MFKVIEGRTFSKILVTVYEPRKFAEVALNYAIKVAQDYDVRLVILYIIRGNANLQTVNPPSHIVQLKKDAQSYLVKVSEKYKKIAVRQKP